MFATELLLLLLLFVLSIPSARLVPLRGRSTVFLFVCIVL